MLVEQYNGARRLFFVGNSLMNHSVGPGVDLFGYYIPTQVYNTVRAAGKVGMMTDCISGQTQTTINSNFATNIAPYITHGDIVVLFEITNDCGVNGATGQGAFNNIVTFRDWVVGCGSKIVICTAAARDMNGDAADLLSRLQTCNGLIRSNATMFDKIADIGAHPVFSTRAGCSNTTYYSNDKIHFVLGGQDIAATIISNQVTQLL